MAISQNTSNDSLGIDKHKHSYRHMSKSQEQAQKKQQDEESKVVQESVHNHAISTLDAIRNRAWKEKWPLVTETELKRTGPWF
jgi:hypothetical protein